MRLKSHGGTGSALSLCPHSPTPRSRPRLRHSFFLPSGGFYVGELGHERTITQCAVLSLALSLPLLDKAPLTRPDSTQLAVDRLTQTQDAIDALVQIMYSSLSYLSRKAQFKQLNHDVPITQTISDAEPREAFVGPCLLVLLLPSSVWASETRDR